MAKAPQQSRRDQSAEPPIDGEVVESTERAISLIGAQASDMDASLVSIMTRAELDQAITTARTYPRSVELALKATREIATLNAATAAECGYALPRGKDENGKANVITGPSVRLAEIVAGRWGNCRAESRTVHVDRIEMFVEAEGMFHDLETNYAVRARVRRSIRGKSYQGQPGKIFSDDMINVTSNAAGSIAFRNAVFKGIPKAIWYPAYEAAQGVVKGTLETLAARRVKLLKAFQDELKIKAAVIYQLLGVAGEADVGLDELLVASGFYSALKNNEVTVEDLLRQVRPTQTPEGKTLGAAFQGSTRPAEGGAPAPGPITAADAGATAQASPQVQETVNQETGEVTETPAAEAGFPGDLPRTASPEPEPETAEADGSAEDDGAQDDERTGAVIPEFLAFYKAVDAAGTNWLSQKQAWTTLRRTDAFKSAPDPEKVDARDHVAKAAFAAKVAGDPVDPVQDMTFFLLWIRQVDPALIVPVWQDIIVTPQFQGSSDETKDALADAYEEAVKAK